MKQLTLAIFVGSIAFSTSANAGFITFSDRATWETAAGGVTGAEDFNAFTTDSSVAGTVTLNGGISVTGGGSWAIDEYGRTPSHPDYQDKKQKDREWDNHLRARREWAKKRAGKSTAHIHDGLTSDSVGDELMQKDLERVG